MQFNSTIYIIFLATVVWTYYQLTPIYRRLLILFSNYIFYWVWSVPFSFLLLGLTFVGFTAAKIIDNSNVQKIRKASLLMFLFLTLGVLCLFKYVDFFSNSVYSLFGFRILPELDLILPLGISFYTFQTISYIIDVYRKKIKSCKSLLDVALYVSFFPQLFAGPINRADVLIPQLACEGSDIDWVNIRKGVGLILWGFSKKVFVADSMANFVNTIYGSPDIFGGLDFLIGTYAFTVQIYCDFSGYSDIAIGSALLLGIHLPKNFDSPYLSYGFQEFWRRWHISLSTWLRDYLYISLGGNRKGVKRLYFNLMITMLLGGLWHGAGWNWVAWGGLHGVLLCIERLINLPSKAKSRLVNFFRWLLTINIISLS